MSKLFEVSLAANGCVGAVVAAVVGLSFLGLDAGTARASEGETPEEAVRIDAGAPVDAEPTADVAAANGGEDCVASDTVMCLQDGRYEVTVEFLVAPDAEPTPAMVVKGGSRPIGTRDSGLFYFFGPKNWELLLKVLDGCGVNQHHWVFAAAATDVGYTITVRDTTLSSDEGVTSMKVYPKAPGAPAPALTDVGAFPDACTASAA